jgi:hypothetical protein
VKFSTVVGKTDTAAVFDPEGPNGSYQHYVMDLQQFKAKRYNDAEWEALSEEA